MAQLFKKVGYGAHSQDASFEEIITPYQVILPVLYLIGAWAHAKKTLLRSIGARARHNAWIVDGISVNSRRMRDGATRWSSLDACYNFVAGEGPTTLHRTVDSWWMQIRNAQAVRNRLKIAKRELDAVITEYATTRPVVRILSLASGSAQGVIEVAAAVRLRGIRAEIVLVDQDSTALRHAEKLAKQYGVNLRTVEANVLRFSNAIGEFKADIVEMMGLLDYLRDSLAIKLLQKIRSYLDQRGAFFCCHIHPNAERYFLKHVVEWDSGMLYRSREAFEDLLIEAGFLTPKLITEPHKIHTVSVATTD